MSEQNIHQEIYERYKHGEVNFATLAREYGVTKERIRQVVAKEEREEHPLRDSIVLIGTFRKQLEEATQGLVGKVDSETMAQYNNLVLCFDDFLNRLRDLDNKKPELTEEKSL